MKRRKKTMSENATAAETPKVPIASGDRTSGTSVEVAAPPPPVEVIIEEDAASGTGTNGHAEHATNGHSAEQASVAVGLLLPPPAATPGSLLHLRVKVWTDRATGGRYLLPTAHFLKVVKGRPISDDMYGYGISSDAPRLIELKAAEWNALPYCYFQEEEPAPRQEDGANAVTVP